MGGAGGLGLSSRAPHVPRGFQQKEMPAGILRKKKKKKEPTLLVGGESGARRVNWGAYLESAEYLSLLAHNKASVGDQVPDDESWMLLHQCSTPPNPSSPDTVLAI